MLVVALGTEVWMRFAIFNDSALARKMGGNLRNADLYARRNSDCYWKLQSAALPDARRKPAPGFDPVVGWRGPRIAAGTYAFAGDDPADPRRPVLLYGDSFAECIGGADTCWQGLLERSDLGQQFVLLNHGVGGYGLDQAYLLYRQTIDRYAGRRPIVIASAFVDNDLARCILSFRGWPKPRLALDGAGKLAFAGPTMMEDVGAYLDREGIGIRSYAWNYLVHGGQILPRSWTGGARAHQAERAAIEEVSAAILQLWHADLAAREIDSFFFVFHDRQHLEPRHDPWEQRFLAAQLAGLAWPARSARDELRADAAATHRAVNEYFIEGGPSANHYTPLGNEVVFRAMRAGLEPWARR